MPPSPSVRIAKPFAPATSCFSPARSASTPKWGRSPAKDAVGQTTQALKNIRAILTAAGLTPEHVIKTTIFLADMNDFAVVNEAYGEFFHDDPPARSTVQVARLPMDAKVEIEAIAMRRPATSA